MSRRSSRRLAQVTRAQRPGTPRTRRQAVGLAAGRLTGRPRWLQISAAVAGTAAGGSMGGPVGALVLGVYGAVAAGLWSSRAERRRGDRDTVLAIETVSMLAAQLRAGGERVGGSLLVAEATAELVGTPPTARAAAWLAAAASVSERLGAPLADLLDRVDADLRADRRMRVALAAHTAGSRATAALLAALPLGGLAIGGAVGADPVHQLLWTPYGAGLTVTALALQGAGLWWSARLVRAAAWE